MYGIYAAEVLPIDRVKSAKMSGKHILMFTMNRILTSISNNRVLHIYYIYHPQRNSMHRLPDMNMRYLLM